MPKISSLQKHEIEVIDRLMIFNEKRVTELVAEYNPEPVLTFGGLIEIDIKNKAKIEEFLARNPRFTKKTKVSSAPEALRKAVEQGNAALTKLLLQVEEIRGHFSGCDESVMLQIAIRSNHINVLKWLVAAGIEKNDKSDAEYNKEITLALFCMTTGMMTCVAATTAAVMFGATPFAVCLIALVFLAVTVFPVVKGCSLYSAYNTKLRLFEGPQEDRVLPEGLVDDSEDKFEERSILLDQ